MRPNRQRFLDKFATSVAFLCGEARVDSNDCMSSVLSFGTQDVEKCAPGGVRDAFREMMVFYHPIDVQIFYTDALVLLSIALGCHARLDQASHEQMVLSFIHEKSILVCPHHPNYILVGIDGQVAQFTHIAQS